MTAIPGFEDGSARANGQRIAFSIGGEGPPVLLLHGFPESREMWRRIAPGLARAYTVVAADLRGYGASSRPRGTEPMRFRHMAADQVALMAGLGFDRFHLVGHDRGARTAHRLALDAPDAVASLTLMDIVPTHLLLDDLGWEVARAYYHWFFLAQPAPLAETMIARDPEGYFTGCLTAWDSGGLDAFDPAALAAYRRAWADPDCIAAMCADYRAALDHDMADDAADLGRSLACPALVLFGADGIMARSYDVGATWSNRLSDMRAHPMPGGHFFPELAPAETLAALLDFLRGAMAGDVR